jgi:ADP-heptose:LPS heptosyltransferase
MKRVLIIRLSSMGDVLLTAPVLKGLITGSPGFEPYLLTKKRFADYFSEIKGLHVVEADTDDTHKGLKGLYLLSRQLKKDINPDIIIDLHSVARSWIISGLLGRGTRTFRIRKGRKEKKAYLTGENRKVLEHTSQRYMDVFRRAGIQFNMDVKPFSYHSEIIKSNPDKKFKIGIAPFARHETKTWPFRYTIELMRLLSNELDAGFYLFGGTEDRQKLEIQDFQDLNVVLLAGMTDRQEEIRSIAGLDLFISMDSGNMHLADLAGVKVFSIWGATHPDLGFRPLNQPDSHVIQTEEELDCRPCSVFGKPDCILTGSKYKCLLTISPEFAARKILASIL